MEKDIKKSKFKILYLRPEKVKKFTGITIKSCYDNMIMIIFYQVVLVILSSIGKTKEQALFQLIDAMSIACRNIRF